MAKIIFKLFYNLKSILECPKLWTNFSHSSKFISIFYTDKKLTRFVLWELSPLRFPGSEWINKTSGFRTWGGWIRRFRAVRHIAVEKNWFKCTSDHFTVSYSVP